MLRHLLPSYRKLVRDGARGEGVILTVEELRSGTIGHSKWRLQIRVKGDGSDGYEFETKVDSHELLGEYPNAGDTWPLRIDPGDNSRTDIDLPAIQTDIRAREKGIEAEDLRRRLDDD